MPRNLETIKVDEAAIAISKILQELEIAEQSLVQSISLEAIDVTTFADGNAHGSELIQVQIVMQRKPCRKWSLA